MNELLLENYERLVEYLESRYSLQIWFGISIFFVFWAWIEIIYSTKKDLCLLFEKCYNRTIFSNFGHFTEEFFDWWFTSLFKWIKGTLNSFVFLIVLTWIIIPAMILQMFCYLFFLLKSMCFSKTIKTKNTKKKRNLEKKKN